MALAILSFMLLTVQVWVQTFERSDQRAAQRFKGEAVRIVLSSLSDKSLSDFANASAFYATYRLANYTAIPTNALPWSSATGTGEDNNEYTGLVEKSAKELMYNGTTYPSTNGIEYTGAQKTAYTIEGWQEKINTAANVMGFNATFSNMTNFSFKQLDAWTIGVYFEIDMELQDLEKTMHHSKTLKANTSFSINGFLDPSVTRNEFERRPGIEYDPSLVAQSQIFKHKDYNTTEDVVPILVDNMAPEGAGWFYGPMTEDYPGEGIFQNTSLLSKIGQYIFVAEKVNQTVISFADLYGALLITTQPGIEKGKTDIYAGCTYQQYMQTNCVNCLETYEAITPGLPCPEHPNNNRIISGTEINVPFIAASGNFGANLSKIPIVNRTGMPDESQQFVLFDNQYETASQKQQGHHRIWDITRLRDMLICGHYVKGIGPSFFQRMLANSEDIKNEELGIETFLAGKWAGGADDQDNDYRSRLDWEFYREMNGYTRIKGMPGCKSKQMCTLSNQNATEVGIGKFKLSIDAIKRYDLGEIACQSSGPITSSPCD